MKDRIKQIRSDAALSTRAFGDRVGISSSAVSFLENGKNSPSEQTIRATCRECGVFREWLETGEGPKYKKKPAGGIRREIADLMGVSEDSPIVDFFETLFNLPPEIRSAFESEFERVREENKKSSE